MNKGGLRLLNLHGASVLFFRINGSFTILSHPGGSIFFISRAARLRTRMPCGREDEEPHLPSAAEALNARMQKNESLEHFNINVGARAGTRSPPILAFVPVVCAGVSSA
jgi:hypothetical protein